MLESASSKPYKFRTYLRHNNITCVISLFFAELLGGRPIGRTPDSESGYPGSSPGLPAKFFLADIPPNYPELCGKNLEILGVAIRNEILKFGFVIEDFQVGIPETPIQV